MIVFGKEVRTREAVYLGLLLFVTIGFLLLAWGYQKTITEYQDAYYECKTALNMAERGQLPTWDEKPINITLKGFNQS